MPSPSQTQPLRAGLYMVVAMACFILNDSCIKIIGTTLPLGQIIAIRGVLSVLVVVVICAHQGVLGSSLALFTPKVLARSLLDVAGTFMFLTALTHMPIANLTAILQSVPLAVVLVSVIFLKEKVGWRRTSAILAGFLGVLLIVRPTPSTFTIYEIIALGIVFILAFRDLITKRIPHHIPTFIIALANASFVALGGILFGVYQGFHDVCPLAIRLARGGGSLAGHGLCVHGGDAAPGRSLGHGAVPLLQRAVCHHPRHGDFRRVSRCHVLCRHGADHCRRPLCGAPGSSMLNK